MLAHKQAAARKASLMACWPSNCWKGSTTHIMMKRLACITPLHCPSWRGGKQAMPHAVQRLPNVRQACVAFASSGHITPLTSINPDWPRGMRGAKTMGKQADKRAGRQTRLIRPTRLTSPVRAKTRQKQRTGRCTCSNQRSHLEHPSNAML